MFKNIRINIGSRIIKTSVSAAIAMLITESLGLDFASLSVVAAILTLQPTFHETLDTSKGRVLGTIVGSLLALPCIYFLQINTALEVFIGVMVILTLSNTFSLTTSSVLGVLSFVSIVTMPDATYMTIVDRLINTLIGVGTSIVINAFTPVQSVSDKTDEIINRALMQDIRLFNECLKEIAGRETSEEELRRLTSKIIAALNEAYNAGMKLQKEQRFEDDYGSYVRFDEKYRALWILHNCALQIQIDKDLFVDGGYSVPESVAEPLDRIISIFDDILEGGNGIPAGTKGRLTDCLSAIERSVADFFSDKYYGSVYEEGCFYTLLQSNLSRFTENIEMLEVKPQAK